ncbi:bifunctional [glutamate--ammonia ligase]-adenylyl-L-tyrosine phosphorylase/[glutamate--ammonia-ligase] adenylyltransferase [Xanthomonadaceae bacterium XH05]|nr:bifunctional [glutamate--ammonia ligase]-adenylyl-L-tyrosine phosphorylase/[glutamate--ammonia-ligase] adenylyltransferase [Xanthomonadaceae bacterium XH05]
MNSLPAPLVELLKRQRERLREAAPKALAQHDARDGQAARLDRLLIASDYALDQMCRYPEMLSELDTGSGGLVLDAGAEERWPFALRRYRHAQSVRLIHRDVNGIDRVEDTLAGTSQLAERCLSGALDALVTGMEASHGTPRDARGTAQRLVVFGLGKLGGSELNFSSDIDLVFAFPEGGESDGTRALDNSVYFQRLGQRLIQLLADSTAEGMAYRVDMRLRPFGQVGRLALSFTAMEQYFQREGRDWERYAWVKARPVAGDLAQGERFLSMLRPFVYRRYLDFGAFEGLREMKSMIESEVQRRDLNAHLKLGRGGIREIEFIVQLQQLIRAGREPALRVRALLPALARLRDRGYIPDHSAEALASAYRFLRRLENRVQMLREEQTHSVPDDAIDRARLAHGLGFSDWETLSVALEQHRDAVSREFARVFEARSARAPGNARADVTQMADVWRDPDDDAAAGHLADAGFIDADALARQLRGFHRLPALTTMSARARARLDRVLPALLAAAAGSGSPDAVAERGLALVQAVLRRSSYLALLDEQPAAMFRLVEVMAGSRWMAERLCAHPLLLDDLLDARADAIPPTRAEVGEALTRTLANLSADDAETRIHGLNEFRQSFAFRVARARLIDRQSAGESTRQLAFVAEAVIGAVLPMAMDDLARQHGRLPRGGLAVVAYGSFGGKELGFGSDLDLVFLYDGVSPDMESDGPRPLDAMRYYTRLVQKVISMLAMPSPAGRLYEADLRLRPDGGKGLLVSSIESFSAYQRERAWTWEQQALVRARAVAGDAEVMQAFTQVRRHVLCARRDAAAVRADAVSMRLRMRAELDRSSEGMFDLKQGEGGLVDLEFLLQAGVLMYAHAAPDLVASTRTPELIDALATHGFLAQTTAQALRDAHEQLSGRALACTLDGRPRLMACDGDLDVARQAVRQAWREHLDVATA